MSIGKLKDFNIGSDSWTLYVERLEQYFLVNNVKEELRVPTLITVVGNDAYELLVNLCTPERPAKKKFEELVTILRDHLEPTPSILAERYKFRLRKQNVGESLAQYAENLKKMTRFCNFEAWLDESLRDQFVCGILNEQIRQRLFTEQKVNFKRAFKISVSMEAAERDSAVVESSRQKAEVGKIAEWEKCQKIIHDNRSTKCQPQSTKKPIVKMTVTTGQATSTSKSHGKQNIIKSGSAENVKRDDGTRFNEECTTCGGRHDSRYCKFRSYTCRICLKRGHLARVCEQVNRFVDVGVESDSSEEVSPEVKILNVDLRQYPPFHGTVTVEKQDIKFEIDSGAAPTCIPRSCYEKYFSHIPLKNCNLVLKYYTGETSKALGKIKPEVKFNGIVKKLEMYVVESGSVCLLGRYWMEELGIEIPVKSCHNVEQYKSTFNMNDFTSRYPNVFAEGLGRYTGGTVSLHVRESATPVYMRERPLPYALRDKVERELEALVDSGVLNPIETSDWATPIVPVMKKCCNLRICADFKITVNKVLEVDRFPVPRIDDVLAKIEGGEKFSKIDLSQAYAQLELDENSKQYCVINTHKGLFRYNRLVYGLSSAPGIFQRKIEQLLCDLPSVGVFLDDIIVTGKDDTAHLSALHTVFERLSRFGLRVREEKCKFFKDYVEYLGFIVSKEGIHTCPKKVECITKTPAPTNVSELRAFLGLVMYYAKFINNIITILTPLYDLLKKNIPWVWSDRCHEAFEKVKKLMMSSKVLAHYSSDLELILTTDASSVGVGAVISHVTPEGERPVAYASRTLTAAERGYSQIDKEALAIIFGVRKFHQFLYARHFVLKTDHKPLVSIFGPKTGIPVMAASRLQRWAIVLAGYRYTVQYVSTKKNCADALSRLPVPVKRRETEDLDRGSYINLVEDAMPIGHKDIKNSTRTDKILSQIVIYLRTGWPTVQDEELKPYYTRRLELYLDTGCIMWGYRMVIPQVHREKILQELHSGHLGIVKMKSIARSYVWWPGIDKDVERTCKQCYMCNAEADAPPKSTPQPWSYPPNPWTRLHIDFIGPYSGRKFLVITDATTKWIEIQEVRTGTTKEVIKILQETFGRFGLCVELVSDNGPPFNGSAFNLFLRAQGIKHTFCSAYHQSSNGAAENAVKICKKALKKAKRGDVDFDMALFEYLLAYRNAEHFTIGTSPALALQRRMLRCRLDLLNPDRDSRVREVQARQEEAAGGVNREIVVEEPEFTDVIENVTVPAGRSVRLACSVKNLGSYKVAWMHFEQSAILTVHNHVITRNPRVSVTHDKHRTWFLHISDVREEDRGRYMCQINTVAAKTQFGYLHVVVPPTIDDSLSSSDVIVREGSNVTLTCRANGSPKPSIKWKRDDNSKISISKGHAVSEWDGEILEMARISRLDMGAYLCIASNGVPPTVSKRVKVSVDFPPMLWIPHQLVGAPLLYNVTLECFTEAHPTSLNYWTRDDGHMIHESFKYHMENSVGIPAYKTHMRLLIRNINHNDYGTYKCVAKNPRGESDGTIRLYTSSPPTTTPDPHAITPPPASRPPRHDHPKVDKGSKYQSNLNEIDKSEQKADEGGKSLHSWAGEPDHVKDGAQKNCQHRYEYVYLACAAIIILILT